MEKVPHLPYKILVGTHHKTGTAWLQSVFEEIAREMSLRFCLTSKKVRPDPGCDIDLNYHSAFDLTSLSAGYRGVHLIRDPRDIIVSGCFYHQTSSEAWLYQPLPRLNGATYHDTINSLPSFDEQLLFEMGFIGEVTIRDILNWDYTNPFFQELKYEDLVQDSGLLIFRDLFRFLGFSEDQLPVLLSVAEKHSLFSSGFVRGGHVRSGDSGQWRKHFKPEHKERFIELFGDALVRLGYEQDDNWALQSGQSTGW
ncbi:MAG TPA: sulfotransferase domain-containing protein [Bacteroidales bacterium]|nr:sulfotransferase domain-containing protein [Bacteroidales bacterium]